MKPWTVLRKRQRATGNSRPKSQDKPPARPPSRVERALQKASDLDCWALVVLGGVVFVGSSQALFHAVWWTPSTAEIPLIGLVVWMLSVSTTVGAGYGLLFLRGSTLPDEDAAAAQVRRAAEAEQTAARATTLREIARDWGDLVRPIDNGEPKEVIEPTAESGR
ncbi:MAG: hypothetical protein EA356_01340 [Geminicoccaceae bacterium]|nr:MAG: hypothetical protein EA356_01340 [Geminicoccaceae bacterium]